MPRPISAIALAVPCVVGLVLGCAKKFQDMRTPSGEFCSDMQVFPAGQLPDHEYHRLKPISSDPETRTEAERLESLRKAACEAGGDAVIEAVNEEVRMPNATYATVSSGTAIIWTRRTQIDTIPTVKSSSEPANATATEEPEPAPVSEPQAAAVEEPEPPPMKPEPAPAKPTKSPVTTTTAPTKTPPATTAKPAPAPTPTTTTKAAAPAPTSSGKATFLKKK